MKDIGKTGKNVFFALSLFLCTNYVFSADTSATTSATTTAPAITAAVNASGDGSAVNAENKKPVMRRQRMPPEAFIFPETFVLIVNHNNALDAEWLEGQCTHMQRQLSTTVKSFNASGTIGLDYQRFVTNIWNEVGDKAKMIVVVSEEENLPAIITAPYENWVFMNAGWVKNGGGDTDTINLRMGKRIFQAIGHCTGAGYRSEREAVMRYSPTPEDMDNCLSHGFHPLNSSIFMDVQKKRGLETLRLRPYEELVEMGILPPRTNNTEVATEQK